MSAQTTKTVGPGEDTPQLFIGIGGCGSRVLQQINRLIARKIANANTVGNKELAGRLEGFSRFVLIDTDVKDLGGRQAGAGDAGRPFDSIVSVSNFDKRAYLAHARGDSFHAADEHLTQWIHENYEPRGAGGAGAGQIRIESRLCVYHEIAEGRLGSELRRVADSLRDIMKVGRQNESAIEVHVVFSIAGGTGAGAFLPLAYYLRNVVFEHVNARIFGYVVMPHAFSDQVGVNFNHVCANSYAALKELDYFNRIGVKVNRASLYAPKTVDFHYDVPNRPANRKVHDRPFDATYVIDRPLDFTLPQEMLVKAVGDWIFTRLYTPLGGWMESDLDNFTRHQTTLYPTHTRDALGKGFSNMYMTAGCCVLNVPHGDLLEYCAHRFAVDALRAYLLLDDPEILPGEDTRAQFRKFAVPVDPKRDAKVTAQLFDSAFVHKMRHLVKAFEKTTGTYWGRFAKLDEEVSKKFRTGFDGVVAELLGEVLKARLPTLDAEAVEDDWKADKFLPRLKEATERARENAARALKSAVDGLGQEWWIQFLGGAGADQKALSPYEQRYVLIALLGQTDESAPLSSKSRKALEATMEQHAPTLASKAVDECQAKLEGHAEKLGKGKATGLWAKLTGAEQRGNEEFRTIQNDVLRDAKDRVKSIEVAYRAQIQCFVANALFASADQMLKLFRDVDNLAPQLASTLSEQLEKFRENPSHVALTQGVVRSDADLYTIDEEALMLTTGEKSRVWDWYYLDQIRPLLGGDRSLTALTSAIQDELKPKYDTQGRTVARSANEVVLAVVKALSDQARVSLKEPGAPLCYESLNLERFLILEATYHHISTNFDFHEKKTPKDKLLAFRELHQELLGETQSLLPESLINGPDIGTKLDGYVRAKVREAVEKAGKLSFFQRSDLTQGETHGERTIAGAHAKYVKDGTLLRRALDGAGVALQADIGWYDPARIFLFTYTTGVPLYAFPRVRKELQADYRTHQAQANKPWHVHIDKNFEELPDLDPNDLHAEVVAEEERQIAKKRDHNLRVITGLFAYDLIGLVVTKGGLLPPGTVTLKNTDGSRAKLAERLSESVLNDAVKDRALLPLIERFVNPTWEKLEPLLRGGHTSEELAGKLSALDERLLDLEVKIAKGELKAEGSVSEAFSTLRKCIADLKRLEVLSGPIGVEL